MSVLEWVARICGEYLMPFLAAFSDSPPAAKIMIIIVGIGIAATAAIKIPSPKKWLGIPIGVFATALCIFAYYFIICNPSFSSDENKGNLQVTFQIMQIWTEDEENGEICTTIPTEELNIENVDLIFKTDNTVYEYSDFKNNTLQFEQLPAGSYDLSIKFADYYQKDQELVLSEDNLKDGQWESQTILLKSQNSSENVSLMVAIQDEPGKSFENAKVTLQPEGATDKVSISLDNEGNSSKKISVADNVPIRAEVNYGDEKQAQSFTICGDSKLKEEETSDESQSYSEDISTDDNNEKYVFIEDQKIYLTFYKPEILEEDAWRLECDEEEIARETEMLQNNPRELLAEQEAAILDLETFKVYSYAEGTLTTENPQQYYPIDLEDNSYWIEFEHAYPYIYDMSSWHIMIIDDSYDMRLDFNASVSSEKTISDIVDLEAGQYYICVESYDGDYVFDINYTLCLKELNSTPAFENAEEFEDKQDYSDTFIYGCISQPDNIDHYSFQLETDAVIAFKFEHALLSDNATIWRITLRDEFDSIIGKISVIGNEPDIISNNIGLTSGGYTIEVSSGDAFYSGIYALSMKQYTCNYWEKEPNNFFSYDEETNSEDEFWVTDDAYVNDDFYDIDETEDEHLTDLEQLQNELCYANELVNGVGIYANLSDCNDVDNFMFTCPESGSYDLLCKHNEIVTDSPGLYIKIYNSTGDLIEDYQFYSDWNSTEIMNTIELIEGETYYISIESNGGWVNEDYLLRVVGNYKASTSSKVSIV